MEFDPDAFLAQAQAQATPTAAPQEESFNPDEFIEQATQEKYGTPGQQAIAGLEAAARGVAGPIATAVEKYALQVKPSDILGREEANPITAGVGEGIGLVGSSLLGVGEGALMTKAGEAVAGLTKAGEIANAAREGALALGQTAGAAEKAAQVALEAQPLLARVGSSTVQQAAEMAVLQSGNEIHKMILNDPETSAQSAIANIGLATALGGAGGAFITGAVSPLWKVTAAEPLNKALTVLKDHMNGAGRLIPEELQQAEKTLGIKIPETIRGANVSETGAARYNDLKRMENPEILKSEQAFHKEIGDSVSRSLGIAPEEVTAYSENQAGHDLYDMFQREYKAKYEPFEAKYLARNAEANKIFIPDESRMSLYENLINKGIQIGTDSPYYKLYNDYAQRVLAKDTVGGIDGLVSEINGTLKKAYREGDSNVIQALNEVKTSLKDFQELQITKQAKELEASGIEGAKKMSAEMLNERAELDRQYREFAKMSNDLAGHLGIGDFKGAKTLEGKLGEKIAPEDLLKKFSFKNNADFIPFLEKYFPGTLEQVRQNELKSILKQSVLSAKGEEAINVKKLADTIEKNMAGKKEYVEKLFSPEALQKIEAARTLQQAIPNIKDSGTPAGLLKNLSNMPASAMAMVAGWLGHNPIIGGIAGHLAHYMGRDMPDAIKLAMLKFSASDQPIKSEGFKSMVEMMHNVIKGETMLNKATSAIFQRGAQVITEQNMPSKADNEKLDKIVTKLNQNPETLQKIANGDTGHYLPAHQVSLTESATRAVEYLRQIKPQPYKTGPLDKEIPPSEAQMQRYDRALTIANNPAVVLQHIKDGTIQMTDIADLKAMYPSLYTNMAGKVSNQMINTDHDEEAIPYRTRMGLSLFLGQAIDSTMTPQAIMAAQPKQPKMMPGNQNQVTGGKPRGATNKLGKANSTYMTPNQASESHRLTKD